ncbi:hypothetical protein ITX31_06740 [Arthrobacter gandavensis]|uniref:hypothetical protein n=1 Tax=Arthrobacter gandavensis TaxID=169960 RepID=UPI00188FD481|nr:hypothetical protein [Arthrobacter gandavensis]MBF4993806.1 hypothetical protein [Arthrobacter gandavensis]
MNQEQNSPPDTGSGTVPPPGGHGPGAADGNPAAAAGKVKRRSRRSTSAPTRLKQAAQLLHTAPAAAQRADAPPAGHGTPGSAAPNAGDGTSAGAGKTSQDQKPPDQAVHDQAVHDKTLHDKTQHDKTPASQVPPGQGSGILPQTAGEDDPRAWGDSPEDSSAWLLEQRPPHWG